MSGFLGEGFLESSYAARRYHQKLNNMAEVQYTMRGLSRNDSYPFRDYRTLLTSFRKLVAEYGRKVRPLNFKRDAKRKQKLFNTSNSSYKDCVDAESRDLRRGALAMVMEEMMVQGKSEGEQSNSSLIDMAKTKAKNYLKRESISFLKQRFGKELFLFDLRWDKHDKLFNDFLRKYDRRFDKHFTFFRDHWRLNGGKLLIPVYDEKRKKWNSFIWVRMGIEIYDDGLKALQMGMSVNQNDLCMYFGGKLSNRLVKEVDNIISRDSSDDFEMGIYNVSVKEGLHGSELEILWKSTYERDMDTLYFSYDEDKKIIQHIDRFLEQKGKYDERHIPFKTGILLYGKPGTGKSSLVNVIAAKYKRHIINIDLQKLNDINLSIISEAINVDRDNEYVVLLEDIDTLVLRRDDDTLMREDKSIIYKMLQFLDGPQSPTNVIFIATTNHLEVLGEALQRSGRFDLKLEVHQLKISDARRFAKSFGLSDEDTESVINTYRRNFTASNGYNQSSLQNMVLSKIDNHERDFNPVDTGVQLEEESK